jgi:hypothetical protein
VSDEARRLLADMHGSESDAHRGLKQLRTTRRGSSSRAAVSADS